MVQTIEQGDIFGKIGKSIGQGVSEQAERSTLAQGLERIAQNKGLSEVQRYGQLLRLPGGAEHASTLIPAIRNQAALQELRTASPSIGTPPAVGSEQDRVPEPPQEVSRRIGTPESIRGRAAERALRNPAQFPTLESAVAQEEKEYLNEKANIEQVNEEFQNILSTKLQKGGKESYADVLGDLQESFRKEAEDAVILGKMSPKEAVRHYTGEALDFAKSRQKLKEVGSLSWLSGSREGKKGSLSEIRKEYEKHDRLDEYKNDLITYEGLSDPAASRFTYPLSPEVKSAVKSASSIGSKLKSTFSYDSIAKKIGNSIQDNDSLLGIAYDLEQNGLSGDKIMSTIQNLYNKDEIKLNSRQARELQSSRNFRPTMNDVYYFSVGGMK